MIYNFSWYLPILAKRMIKMMIYISTGIAIVMAMGVFMFRMKETKKPVNEKKSYYPTLYEYGCFDVSFPNV